MLCGKKGTEDGSLDLHRCDGHSFELALLTPIGESKKLTIVQCSQCGTPIGVVDLATAPQIETLEKPDRGDRRTAQPDCEGAAGMIVCSM
jgi:hypothetical protein